eukprot:TRINITY_DN54505_c0_g1_i1.p2 TRINITY_DN54505_c0_g1~~TRINITY_DN54505_c0_g1_i1.p2  ORF type:complete len:156 (-),score=15.14 TRINITY_DN54505_c0_g1_i1:25-492(-)
MFYATIFRVSSLRTEFPGAIKFLKVVGVQEYVLNDQRQPCSLSHPGVSCSLNAARMYRKFWLRMVPVVCLSRVLWAAATGKTIRVVPTLRYMLFLFLSSGVPGYVYCLLKPYTSATGEGTVGNVLLSALVGLFACLLYTSPSPRDRTRSRMPSSA